MRFKQIRGRASRLVNTFTPGPAWATFLRITLIERRVSSLSQIQCSAYQW